MIFDLAPRAGYNPSFSRRNFKPVKNQRPINLNLFTIRQPIAAIISILHRISGVILFLLIPFILWGLSLSLSSQQDFQHIYQILTTPSMKFFVWCFLAAFTYHFVAGIRHLFMDAGIGESLNGGRLTAVLTVVITFILMILIGVWLW